MLVFYELRAVRQTSKRRYVRRPIEALPHEFSTALQELGSWIKAQPGWYDIEVEAFCRDEDGTPFSFLL